MEKVYSGRQGSVPWLIKRKWLADLIFQIDILLSGEDEAMSSGSISKSMPAQHALSNSSAAELISDILCGASSLHHSRLEKLALDESRISWLVIIGFMLFAFVLPNYHTTKRVYN